MKLTNTSKILFLTSILLIQNIELWAQPSNDECQNAIRILDPIDFCSGDAEFTSVNATPSGFGPASCFNSTGNDVWYSFQAFATAINVVLLTKGDGNNLDFGQLALYSGSCTSSISELACRSDNTNSGAISLLENGLTIGETYLIRVSAANENTGLFNLCTNNYNPPVEPGQDCRTGAILCDKSPFVVQVLSGGGALPDEGDGTCLEGGVAQTITEDQSTWLKWTAGTNGSLTFTITPLKSDDDIDFALFELSDIDACINTTPIRCMATACPGPTGLDLTSTDFEEDFNCDRNEDGFVKFIDMVAGNHYGLLINNFSNTSIGFNIEFGGDGEFAGPNADFNIQPDSGLRCDQDFIITDQSTFPNGTIDSYEWNFGERALPNSSTLKGPHQVNYESFGEKFIVLTVVSDKGCRVTKVLPLYAEPCCDDIDMLDISLVNAEDPNCWYSNDGSIEVIADGTNLEYFYAINGGEFSENPMFNNLGDGEFKINTFDIKGCEDSITVELLRPDTIFVNAGRDTTIKLGTTTFLNGSFSPDFGQEICWDPAQGTSDITILNPEVFPFGTTEYTLSIKDQNGCITSDVVVIMTDDNREVHAPNIFSPNSSPGVNDYFNIYGNLAIQTVETLAIFDRWGNKMYDASNIPINSPNQGWDGKFNGRQLDPGVYVWYAKVRFIDGVIKEYGGDITLMR